MLLKILLLAFLFAVGSGSIVTLLLQRKGIWVQVLSVLLHALGIVLAVVFLLDVNLKSKDYAALLLCAVVVSIATLLVGFLFRQIQEALALGVFVQSLMVTVLLHDGGLIDEGFGIDAISWIYLLIGVALAFVIDAVIGVGTRPLLKRAILKWQNSNSYYGFLPDDPKILFANLGWRTWPMFVTSQGVGYLGGLTIYALYLALIP